MKRTISAMSGDGVVAHNRRTYIAENVDQTRTHLNIEYCYTPIEQAYHELFDEAQAEYNAKQKRKDRRIENYYEKICNGDQEKPFYEVIFQVGNKDDMGAASENGALAKEILDKFYHSFLERNPQLHVYSAHLHMDEATPHLHIDFIPFTTGSKRGLSTRVSLKQALADQGITGEGRSLTERDLWVQKEKKALAEIMLEHAKQKYLVVDSTKIDLINFYRIGTFDLVDAMVIDRLDSTNWKNFIYEKGIRLIEAGKENENG